MSSRIPTAGNTRSFIISLAAKPFCFISVIPSNLFTHLEKRIFILILKRGGSGHRYTMNTNFRSSEKFIEAMNLFFQPLKILTPLLLKGRKKVLNTDGTLASPNKKGELTKGSQPVVPITITAAKSKDICMMQWLRRSWNCYRTRLFDKRHER